MYAIEEASLHPEEHISLGPEDQNTSSDEDKDEEAIVIIDNKEDKELVKTHLFIKGKLFNGCLVTSNCEKIYKN